MSYSVVRDGVSLNANFDPAIEISLIVSALEDLFVTGAVEATRYSTLVYVESVSDRKDDVWKGTQVSEV